MDINDFLKLVYEFGEIHSRCEVTFKKYKESIIAGKNIEENVENMKILRDKLSGMYELLEPFQNLIIRPDESKVDEFYPADDCECIIIDIDNFLNRELDNLI